MCISLPILLFSNFHSLIYLQPFAIFPSPYVPLLRYTFSIVHSPSFLFFQAIIFGQGYITKVTDTLQPSQLSSLLHSPFLRPPSTPGLHHKSHSHNSSFSQLFFPFLFQFHLCHLFRPRLHLESHLPFGSFQLNLYLTWIILCLSNLEILLLVRCRRGDWSWRPNRPILLGFHFIHRKIKLIIMFHLLWGIFGLVFNLKK